MPEHWVIPCNTKVFDITERFESGKTVVWKSSYSMKKGDVVYIYLTKPVAEILYRCNVIDDSVDNDIVENNSYVIRKNNGGDFFPHRDKYVMLQHDKTYTRGTFPYDELKQNGLGQVQLVARTSRVLQQFIDSKEKGDD